MEEFVYSLPLKFRIPALRVLRVLGEIEIFLLEHPRKFMAALGFVLLGGGGGAFALANLGPDASLLPVQIVSTPVETPQLRDQAAALDLHDLQLFRSEVTRSSDTPESLLRRLSIVDPDAVAFFRKNSTARDGISRAGRNISAQANERQQLLTLTTRWLRNDNDTVSNGYRSSAPLKALPPRRKARRWSPTSSTLGPSWRPACLPLPMRHAFQTV